MKTSILNLRLDTNTRAALDQLCIEQEKSASAVARDAIDLYLTKSQVVDSPDTSILQTFGFAELIYWIMDKRIDHEALECLSFYQCHVDLISEMELNPLFPEDFMVEMRKVQLELIEHINEENSSYNFRFPTQEGFDYSKLNEFIHIVRFDNDNNRVIHIK